MTETGKLRCGSGGAATAGTLGTAAVELDSGHEGGGASGHEGEGRMQSVFLAKPPQVYIEPFWAAEESIFCAFSLLPANLAILAFLQYIKILKLHNKNYYYEFNYRYYF